MPIRKIIHGYIVDDETIVKTAGVLDEIFFVLIRYAILKYCFKQS